MQNSNILNLTISEDLLDYWIQYSILSDNPKLMFYENMISEDNQLKSDFLHQKQSDPKEIKEKKAIIKNIISAKSKGFSGFKMIRETVPKFQEKSDYYLDKIKDKELNINKFLLMLEDKIKESITNEHVNKFIDTIATGIDDYKEVNYMGNITKRLNNIMVSFLGKIAMTISKNNYQILNKETVDSIIEEKAKANKTTIHEKVKTGYSTFDNVIWSGGMQKSRLYLVAGKAGVGKSVFTINLAKNFVEQGKSVMLFTLENTKDETVDRFIQCLQNESINKLDTGLVEEKVRKFFANTNGSLDIEGVPQQTLTKEMIDTYINIRENEGVPHPDVIIIDYLDLMKCSSKVTEERIRLSRIANDLKQLQQEQTAVVITPTQVVKSSYKKPLVDLEDISESGGKAYVSDAVLLLNGSSDEIKTGYISIYIGKNRHGKSYQSIIFNVDFEKMKFEDSGKIGKLTSLELDIFGDDGEF